MRFITGLFVGIVIAFTMLVTTNTNNKTTANIAYVQPNEVNEDEFQWLAKNIYFEAGDGSLAGMLAVGLVVMNRVKDGRYPHDVVGVITQAKRDAKGNIILNQCQFSWYCDGKPDIPNVKDPGWAKAQVAARMVLEGRVIDFTDGATHFHTDKVTPNWGFPKVAHIDDHTFYKRNR
jgi:N-acetylmuramoyl-L-alanine amidase